MDRRMWCQTHSKTETCCLCSKMFTQICTAFCVVYLKVFMQTWTHVGLTAVWTEGAKKRTARPAAAVLFNFIPCSPDSTKLGAPQIWQHKARGTESFATTSNRAKTQTTTQKPFISHVTLFFLISNMWNFLIDLTYREWVNEWATEKLLPADVFYVLMCCNHPMVVKAVLPEAALQKSHTTKASLKHFLSLFFFF